MMPPASSIPSPLSTDADARFDVVPLPAFNDNYIWMLVPRSPSADLSAWPAVEAAPGVQRPVGVTVVDPGQAAPVMAYLRANNAYLSAILLTHHHADHVGGVPELLVFAEQQVQEGQAPSLPPVYGPVGEDIATVTHPVSGGNVVETASPRAHFTVIDVPGHTRAHIAYFTAGASAAGAASPPADGAGTAPASIDQNQPPRVFCGDTLFATGCGRLFEGTPAQMLASLDRLAALPDATLVHCAHEYTLSNIRFARAADPENADLSAWSEQAEALRAAGRPTVPTTLALERRVNPFLRADAPAIAPQLRAAMAGQAHGAVSEGPMSRLAAFTQLRAWKDRF